MAFLVNPENADWQEQLDAIWKFNQERWGGRYNPIIPTDGASIKEGWWRFLRETDPDYVFSTVSLSKDLVKEIEARICPIEVELPRQNQDPAVKPYIMTFNDGVPILPTDSNLRKLSSNFLFDPVLALINGNEYASDKTIFRFILHSFGAYPNVVYMNNALEKVERQISLKANDKDGLVASLKALSQPSANLVFPIQFSMLGQPRWYVEFDDKHSYEDCLVIIGDTFEEHLFTWNRPYYSRDTKPNRINHIWIPTALAKDQEIAQALGLWLRRVASNIHFCTFSLSSSELDEIGNQITEDTPESFQSLYKDITVLDQFPFPRYPERRSFYLSLPQEIDYYRAYNVSDGFEVKTPSQTESLPQRGHWIAEVYTEADRSRLYSYTLPAQSRQSWWQFPRKNYLARNIFKTNSQLGTKVRVNLSGIPCVQLPARSPILKVDLPSDFDLVRHAIEGDYYGDGREHYRASPSNIGRYLTGFLQMFGSLDSAYQVLASRYWRRVFDVLSKRDLTQDEMTLEMVRNSLTKRVTKSGSISKLKAEIDDFAEFVIRLAKQTHFEGRTLVYDDLRTEAEKELKEFNETEGQAWEFEEKALQRDISEMLQLGILLMGLSQRCPRCWSANWYQVNEVKQDLQCEGCRFSFSLRADPKWSYRLSSLVRQGIAFHGLVPVVLALGQILRRADSSFFFSPSLNFDKVRSYDPPDYERLGDLDVACISDGKLIIGEIKLSQGLFDLEQMMKLADIAETISADVLLFSSLDAKPANKLLQNIEKVKEKLKHTKVEVEWYQLEEHIFEPEPVR